MAISITRHQIGSEPIYGAQLSDSIDVANGTKSAALTGGVYRVKATSASIIRIGPSSIANATGGERLDSGETEARIIPDGYVIACDAG